MPDNKSTESSLLEALPYPVALLDEEGRLRGFNQAFCTWAGFPSPAPDQAAIPLAELPFEEKAQWLDFLRKNATKSQPTKSGEISPGVFAHWLPKGNAFYPALSLWMCSRMGHPQASKEAEYIDERFYRLAVEHSSNFIFLLNRDYSLLFASPSVEQVFGYSSQKLKGASFKLLLREAEFERFKAACAPLWAQKKQHLSIELQAQEDKGGTYWLALSVVRPQAQAEPLDLLMVSARDVSLQKKYEIDLTLQRNHYQYLFDHNPSPLLIISQESCTILKVNQTAQYLYGYPSANFVGKHLASFCSPPEQARFVAWMKEDKREFFAISPDFIHQRQDQSLFYVNIRGHYFEYEGQPAYLLLITDVTQRVKAAQRIQKLLDNEQSINEELRASEEMLRQSLEELKTLHDQRKYDADFKSILLETFVRFINLDYAELDQQIDELLIRITEFSGFDRARLILFHQDGVQAFVKYEYAGPHLPPSHSSTQNFLIAQFPWWIQQLRQNEVVAVPSLDDLPPEAENERHVLEINNSQSAYAFPMLYQQKLMGYIVFFGR
ncbi:MAG: PAS domain S-box protein [Microscillaceae bacterium]|nr:PAS domain S-box protein [Microscillaceae bacterium]